MKLNSFVFFGIHFDRFPLIFLFQCPYMGREITDLSSWQ